MQPNEPVCLIVPSENHDDTQVFLGTCFALRSRSRFITAAHCVANPGPKGIAVYSPAIDRTIQISTIEVHPTADIAVLMADAPFPHNFRQYDDCCRSHSAGDDFEAFGFPEDVFGPEQGRPVARYFKGHFQRFFNHNSRFGYQYLAGELSIGCPAGLSGGPVFRQDLGFFRVFGVVAENLETTTYLDSVEEVERPGQITRHTYSKVINYGVCVMLSELDVWLNRYAPGN